MDNNVVFVLITITNFDTDFYTAKIDHIDTELFSTMKAARLKVNKLFKIICQDFINMNPDHDEYIEMKRELDNLKLIPEHNPALWKECELGSFWYAIEKKRIKK